MPRVLTAAHRQVNWSDPLSRGLIAAVIYPSGPRPVELVGYGQIRYTGTLASVAGLSPYGTAGDHPQGAGRQGWSISNIMNRPATATAGSVLYIRRRYGSLADSGFGCTSASTASFGGHLVWNDGNLYWDFGGNAGSNRVSASSPNITVDSVLILTAGPSGMFVYQDGKLLASSTTAVARALSTSDFGLTYGNSITNVSSRVDTLTLVAERQWTPQEVAQLTLDPFRVLEIPRARRHFTFLMSGAAAQNLDGATGTVTITGVPGALTASGSVALPSATGTVTLTGVPGALTASGAAALAGAIGTVTLTGVPGALAASGTAALAGAIGTITITGVPGALGNVVPDSLPVRLIHRDDGYTIIGRDDGYTLNHRD